MFNVQQALVPS